MSLASIPNTWSGFKGYNSDPNNCGPDFLSSPAVNCMIDTNGGVGQRLGYANSGIDLNESGKTARSFYHEQYDITVFSIGTKLKYYDWTSKTVYDTGLTLTDGTITRMDSFAGDAYSTNTTDGLRRLVFGRVNDSAANSGDSDITVDTDMAARLSVFSITSGNLRINGTDESFNAVTVSTGVIGLTGTLSQDYDDNAIALVTSDISSGREKASKPFFWKERMGLIGSQFATNADQPNATVYFGKFAVASNLEDIIDFTYGSGGSTKELVGKWGRLTNAVPAKDYLYLFKQSQAYTVAAENVALSGSSIGQSTPDLRDENNGCLNEDSAVVVGNNEICYITADKRILRIRIATDSGAPVLYPDESFDVPMRKHLENMDADQTGAMAVYHKSKRRSIFQIKILGQWHWLVYDHAINQGKGGWQPPQQVVFASDFFERKGILYACDGSDDTVWSIGTEFDDNMVEVYSVFATGNFNVRASTMLLAEAQGEISQAARLKLRTYVTNETGGRQGGSEKQVSGAGRFYSEDHGVGADAVGEGGVEQVTVQTADWQKEWDIYPSEGHRVQLVGTNSAGGYWSLTRYSIIHRPSRTSFTSSK